jgi:hypothetical protein
LKKRLYDFTAGALQQENVGPVAVSVVEIPDPLVNRVAPIASPHSILAGLTRAKRQFTR